MKLRSLTAYSKLLFSSSFSFFSSFFSYLGLGDHVIVIRIGSLEFLIVPLQRLLLELVVGFIQLLVLLLPLRFSLLVNLLLKLKILYIYSMCMQIR